MHLISLLKPAKKILLKVLEIVISSSPHLVSRGTTTHLYCAVV